MQIRQALAVDMNDILQLDHDYETGHVWQMELEMEEQKVGARFRPTRLPRPMKVSYPRKVQWVTENWKRYAAFFVAHENDQLIGYLTVSDHIHPNTAWIADWAVLSLRRRQGIGTQLLLAAQKWTVEKKMNKLSVEMQSKNMPAVLMLQKMGFEFSGYNDRFYENQDIALFFTKRLI